MITRSLHIGQTVYFTGRATFFKGRPRQCLTWVSLEPINLFCLDLPFCKTSPGILLCFILHSTACNEKEAGHLLFEHLLVESKTHLSWVHLDWEYFLRVNGAAKRGKLCIVEGVRIDLNFFWFLAECWNTSTGCGFFIYNWVNLFR